MFAELHFPLCIFAIWLEFIRNLRVSLSVNWCTWVGGFGWFESMILGCVWYTLYQLCCEGTRVLFAVKTRAISFFLLNVSDSKRTKLNARPTLHTWITDVVTKIWLQTGSVLLPVASSLLEFSNVCQGLCEFNKFLGETRNVNLVFGRVGITWF